MTSRGTLHWEAAFCALVSLGRWLLAVGVGQHLGGTLRWPRRRVDKTQRSPWPSSSSHHTLSLQDAVETSITADFPFSTYLNKYKHILSSNLLVFILRKNVSIKFLCCYVNTGKCVLASKNSWEFMMMPWLSLWNQSHCWCLWFQSSFSWF